MRRPTGQLYKRFGGRDLKPDHPQCATFYLRYELDGRRHAICLGVQDLTKARTLADEHLARIDRSDRVSYLRSLVTLGKLAEAELAGQAASKIVLAPETLWTKYEASRRRPQSGPSTMGSYKAQISRFAHWAKQKHRNLLGFGPHHAEEYVGYLEQEHFSAYTIRVHLATLKRTWRVLLPDAKNPWTGLQPAGQHKIVSYRRLTATEMQTIAKSAAAIGAEERLLIMLGYYTALRLSDASLLQASAYDRKTRTLNVIPSKTAKRKPSPLSIPVMPELAEAIHAGHVPADGPMLPRLAAEQLTRNNTLSQRIARMIRESGEGDTDAGKASFHSLRATFISLMDEAGAPQAITDSITGHAPSTMHARYSHPDTSVARTWMEKALPRLTC